MSEFDRFRHGRIFGTTVYPVHATEVSGLLQRVEGPLTPALLRSRFLKIFELNLPWFPKYTDDELKDEIMRAYNEVEIIVGVTITRERFKQKLPFDPNLYRNYIHLRTEHRPIVSIERLEITASNQRYEGHGGFIDEHGQHRFREGEQQVIYTVPSEWIETANLSKGLINVIPLLGTFGVTTFSGQVSSAGLAFLAIIGQLGHIPSYWNCEYTSGMCNKEGNIPVVVNELAGAIAAINILSGAAIMNIYTSSSISQDGLSQSASNLGPRIFMLRIEELQRLKEELTGKIKNLFQTKWAIGNI